MSRLVLAIICVVVGCKSHPDTGETPTDPPLTVTAVAVPPIDAAPIDAAPIDAAPIDAASGDPVETRLRGYARLLAVDFAVFQLVGSYPGAPKGTVFSSVQYWWRNGRWRPTDTELAAVAAILASSRAMPEIAPDAPVHAYGVALSKLLPHLASLDAYYNRSEFIDDEFDRGRTEGPQLLAAGAELAKLRAPMRRAVYEAWVALVAVQPDGPRAVIGRGWIACMSVADRIMEKATDEAISKEVSACRRSVGTINNTPATQIFAQDLRSAAVGLGDSVAEGRPTWNFAASDALLALTERYTQLWPTLPVAPAEKP